MLFRTEPDAMVSLKGRDASPMAGWPEVHEGDTAGICPCISLPCRLSVIRKPEPSAVFPADRWGKLDKERRLDTV